MENYQWSQVLDRIEADSEVRKRPAPMAVLLAAGPAMAKRPAGGLARPAGRPRVWPAP